MTLLDRLLPQGWQSQVASTFGPKRYDKLAPGDFTPGKSDRPAYDNYLALLQEGYMPTEQAYDEFVRGNAAVNPDAWDKESQWFSDYWVDPSQLDPVNVFDPGSLRAGFERAGMSGVGESMFTPFQAGDLRALDPSSYTKELESSRSNLASSLQKGLQRGAGLGGGFAGYGGRGSAQDLAMQQYEQGAEGLYADINKQRAGAVQGLYSKLEDYDKLISQAT